MTWGMLKLVDLLRIRICPSRITTQDCATMLERSLLPYIEKYRADELLH